MRRLISTIIVSLSVFVTLFAQVDAGDFLQIVTLESEQGAQAVFTSAGMGESRDEAEMNAVKSLFYT